LKLTPPPGVSQGILFGGVEQTTGGVQPPQRPRQFKHCCCQVTLEIIFKKSWREAERRPRQTSYCSSCGVDSVKQKIDGNSTFYHRRRRKTRLNYGFYKLTAGGWPSFFFLLYALTSSEVLTALSAAGSLCRKLSDQPPILPLSSATSIRTCLNPPCRRVERCKTPVLFTVIGVLSSFSLHYITLHYNKDTTTGKTKIHAFIN
jgi:hypothetical protein